MARIKKLVTSNFFLVIILILASFLRLYKITKVPVSLFGDELDVGYHAYSILKTGRDYSGNPWPLHFQSLAEWRTPLYIYASVPTVSVFGISPLGVRLPAAIFGIVGVWGMYLLVKELFNNKVKIKDKLLNSEFLALIAAGILAISPWHIQYSRAAFEVTQLLAFLIFGLYFFFRSLENGKWFPISILFLVLTPFIYSTAKLFTPMLFLFLIFFWKNELIKLGRKNLIYGAFVGLVFGLPIAYSTFFEGGTERFGYLSVFTDPTKETEIGYEREFDAAVRGEIKLGLQPNLSDKFFHNKFTFWGFKIVNNYLNAFSTDFLFIRGDLNLRHSIGMGQFYKVEFTSLILGLILFFSSRLEKRMKLLIAFWLLAGVIPASLTRDGGNHATRLILILPPLIFLIAYGLVDAFVRLRGTYRFIFFISYFLLLINNFIFYVHNYYIHYP